MREFIIYVAKEYKVVSYPPLSGKHALCLMRRMKSRGLVSMACTTMNGITEYLSLYQMQKSVIV